MHKQFAVSRRSGILDQMEKRIRSARLDDASAILAIYAPFIRETAISFETEVPSLVSLQQRISVTQEKYPWLVCETEGRVVGYAYAGPYRSRCAYDWSVETTVYVDQNFHGRGIGTLLYQTLLKILKDQGVVNVIGGIALPNPSSIALHERLGFKQVATFSDVGFKLGRWWDVGFWQIQLQKPTVPTSLCQPVVPLICSEIVSRHR